MLILVVGDGLSDLPFQPMDGEIHLGDANGVAVFLLAVEHDFLCCVSALILDEMTGLDEHTARSAGRVENSAVIRFDDVDDCLDQRRRGEKFSVVMCLLDRELS